MDELKINNSTDPANFQALFDSLSDVEKEIILAMLRMSYALLSGIARSKKDEQKKECGSCIRT